MAGRQPGAHFRGIDPHRLELGRHEELRKRHLAVVVRPQIMPLVVLVVDDITGLHGKGLLVGPCCALAAQEIHEMLRALVVMVGGFRARRGR